MNRFLSFITWPWLRTRPRAIRAVRILDQFQVHASFTINNGTVTSAKRRGQRGGRSELWEIVRKDDMNKQSGCCHDRHRVQLIAFIY